MGSLHPLSVPCPWTATSRNALQQPLSSNPAFFLHWGNPAESPRRSLVFAVSTQGSLGFSCLPLLPPALHREVSCQSPCLGRYLAWWPLPGEVPGLMAGTVHRQPPTAGHIYLCLRVRGLLSHGVPSNQARQSEGLCVSPHEGRVGQGLCGDAGVLLTGKAPVSSTHPENPRVPPGGGMWLNVGFMPFPPTHTPDLDSDLEAKEICRSV